VRGATRVRRADGQSRTLSRHTVGKYRVNDDTPVGSPPQASACTTAVCSSSGSLESFSSPVDCAATLSAAPLERSSSVQPQGGVLRVAEAPASTSVAPACVASSQESGGAPRVQAAAEGTTHSSAWPMNSALNCVGGGIRRFNIVDAMGNRMKVSKRSPHL